MQQSIFDNNARRAVGQVIRRLYAISNPSGADGRVCAWFKANLSWVPIDINNEGLLFQPGPIDPWTTADVLGVALFSADPPNTADPTVAAQGSYATLCKTAPLLVAEINWNSYSALSTATAHYGPTLQVGDLDAAIAAT